MHLFSGFDIDPKEPQICNNVKKMVRYNKIDQFKIINNNY